MEAAQAIEPPASETAKPKRSFGFPSAATTLAIVTGLVWIATRFILASVLVGVVARMGEKEVVRLIAAGASDTRGPALVVWLAGGFPGGQPRDHDRGLDLRPRADAAVVTHVGHPRRRAGYCQGGVRQVLSLRLAAAVDVFAASAIIIGVAASLE